MISAIIFRRFCTVSQNSASHLQRFGARAPSKVLFQDAQPAQEIEGLNYYPDYVTEEEASALKDIIDRNKWLVNIRRRQQHYGIVYYHTRHNLCEIQPATESESSENALDLSQFDWVMQRLINDKIFVPSDPPNQCLVNEYDSKDKLGCHVENIQAFGPIIAGLSLCCPSYLALRECANKENKLQVFLQPRSLYVLRGDARYNWEHGVSRMKSFIDPSNQQVYVKDDKYRRISLTFRHVLQEGTKKVERGNETEAMPNFFKKNSL